MNKKISSQILLFAALVAPLQDSGKWNVDRLTKVPPNEVSFSKDGMLVKVQKSNNPIIWALGKPVKIISFEVHGEFLGLPHFRKVAKQGGRRNDDYPLRIGFVVPGDKKLIGIHKYFSPEWLKRIYRLLPLDAGIDSVQFFDITQNPAQVGHSRVHPSSNMLHEDFIDSVAKPGPFSYTFTLKQPLDAVAVWIWIDGDDTKSTYSVSLSQLTLQTE